MRPGVRVLRGPDWCHGNQDGGIGCLGTVVKVFPNNTVQVTWDIGTETVCRAGNEDSYDLRVFDNAQIGVRQGGVTCDIHQRDPGDREVRGFRWKCLVCDDYDECSECYHGIRHPVTHDTSHAFVRFNMKRATVVRVPPRRKSKRIPIYGIFPGAKVTKVATDTTNRDMAVGIVKEVIDMQHDSWTHYRGGVKVEWTNQKSKKKVNEDGTVELPTYRIGAEGKVELKLLEPVSPGSVYIDHLPILDLTSPSETTFKTGDTVRIDLNLETFKAMQSVHVGWVNELEEALGEEGRISEIKDKRRRIVSVKYDRIEKEFDAICMNVLTKVTKINSGDTVQVTRDERKMKELQVGHGGWQQAYISILGRVGHVLRIDDKDALVDIDGDTFVLNPECLTVTTEPVQKNKGDQSKTVTASKDLLRSRSFHCPVPASARRRKPLPGIKMGSSPSHNTAADSSSIKCDVCQRQNKTSTAVSYCKDCEETLCKICDNVHQNSEVSQNHIILTGDQFKQETLTSKLQDTKTYADGVPGLVADTTNSVPSTVLNTAGAVHGRLKDANSDNNSVPGRTKDTNSDSNNAVDGVKVAKHNPDSVPGLVKDTQISVVAVSGRALDMNYDQNSGPGHVKDTKTPSSTVSGKVVHKNNDQNYNPGYVKDTKPAADAVSGRVVDQNNDQNSVPGRVKDTNTSAGAVSGRVMDKNNDQNSVRGRKLDSSSDTDIVDFDLTVSNIKHHNVSCQRVQSVLFMPNGLIVLACTDDGLKLLDKDFKQLCQLSILSVCACKVSDNEILVSQGIQNQIQFVEVLPKMVARDALTFERVSSGICHHNGEIYVACCDDVIWGCGEVRVVDRQGTLKRRIGYYDGKYMFAEPWDVKVNDAGDKVFVSDIGTHSVTGMDNTGRVLYRYKDTDLMYPSGLLVDSQDNVLITAGLSHNVHVINKAGNQHKIVLTRKDGLYGPMCISYRQDDGLLAIGVYSKDGTYSLMTMRRSLS